MTPVTASVLEGNALVLAARITDEQGRPLQRVDLSAVAYRIVDVTQATARHVSGPTSLTVAEVVFDSLQTGSDWYPDAAGYNFRMPLPSGAFIDDAVFTDTNARDRRIYQVVIKFTPVDATRAFYQRFEFKIENNLYER